jgi:hypothetical protein
LETVLALYFVISIQHITQTQFHYIFWTLID